MNELDSGWYPALYILIGISALLIIGIVIYFFNLKYRIRYFVNGQLVNTVYYKKNALISKYTYNEIENWYVDEECTEIFVQTTMPDRNIKLYATISNIDYE